MTEYLICYACEEKKEIARQAGQRWEYDPTCLKCQRRLLNAQENRRQRNARPAAARPKPKQESLDI